MWIVGQIFTSPGPEGSTLLHCARPAEAHGLPEHVAGPTAATRWRVWKSLSLRSSFWAEHIQVLLVPSVHAISLCCTRTTSGMPSLSGHLWLGPPPPLSALCDPLPGSGLSLLCPFPGSPVCPSVLCPCSCLLPSSSHLLPNPPSACLRLSSSPGPMLCPSAPLIRAPLLPSLFASLSLSLSSMPRSLSRGSGSSFPPSGLLQGVIAFDDLRSTRKPTNTTTRVAWWWSNNHAQFGGH